MEALLNSVTRRPAGRSALVASLWLASLTALPAMAADSGVVMSASGDAWVGITKPHRYADVFLDTDTFQGVYTLKARATDVDRPARLLLVASVDGRWFSHDGVRWHPWSGKQAELKTWGNKMLQAEERIPFVTQQALFAGDYKVYAGYQIADEPIVYSPEPLQFRVNSAGSDALLRFRSETAMEAYLKEGLQNGNSPQENYLRTVTLATAAPTDANAGASTTKSSERTSSTNLQEVGVDEADTVKVDGSTLYSLVNCKDAVCLDVQTLDSAKATATPLTSFALDDKVVPDGIYLVDKGVGGRKMLVTVAGEQGFGGWFRLWAWSQGKTALQFIDVADPAKPASVEKLSFDGALVASRRVGNVLYLVTRYTPALEGFNPYPFEKAELAKNEEVLAKADLPDILPRVEDSRKQVEELIKSKDCYLPTSAVDGNLNPSIITITSVPLDAPANHTSTCFLGASETLYMTPDSLYLATTSWDYVQPAQATDLISYAPLHTTAIHKFALAGSKIEYRGSGEVRGHLGWEEDKKSFRMGEHAGYLNVATSIGETWDGTSSTLLTVLKENPASKTLSTVKVIDGIGLKGERLYAARFLGDRGYLVTFRVTDPLYVLDLSNQEQPKLIGELKIDGYSDYLHPVGDNLLLGIGKDAVPDTRSDDLGGGRGAWYQGVKLSLFDVSNPAAPKEINSLVIGKRGTESEVLWDHHALSYLPPVGTEPARLAIPIQLHDKVPTWEGFKASEPSAWYDYTHTALYSFELSGKGVSRVGRLISEVASEPSKVDPVPRLAITSAATSGAASGSSAGESSDVATTKPAVGVSILPIDTIFAPVRAYYGDRSVLKDDAVFYLHDGKVLTSRWGESKN